MPCNSNFGQNFELEIRNYFRLFLRTTTHFELKFKLDSEEATHSHPLSPIDTLSVVWYIKGCMSICVNAHCLMLEVLRYIALNALNTVQKIKAMSKMSKIDKVHIRGVQLCMSKMSKMGKAHTHTFWLICQRCRRWEKHIHTHFGS